MRHLVLVAVAALPLAAQGAPVSLDGTAWTATRIGARPASADRMPTLRFEGRRVVAHDGCNGLTGTVTHRGDTITIATLAGTMMACPPDLDAQSGAYRDALTSAARTRVTGDRLVLLTADGKELAEFRRESGALAGTAWAVTMINNGRGAVASLVGGTTASLSVDGAGRLTASAGCNALRATVAQTGERVRVSPVRATRKRCPAADGVMAQEQQLVRALRRATRVRIDGDRLELRDAAGALQLSARRVGTTGTPDAAQAAPRGTASLVNTYWRIVRLAGQPVTTVPDHREPHMILRERNGVTEVSATVGCNGMGGTVTVSGDRVTFGNLMGTMMACDEPLMSRERALRDALARARTAHIVGETLALRDDAGKTLASFEAVHLR